MTSHVPTAAAWSGLLRTEGLLLLRHHVVLAAFVTTVGWAGLLRALPASARPEAVSWVLLLEVASLGFFFIPALSVVERGNGVTAALGVTPLRAAQALATRLGAFAALSSLAATLVLLAGDRRWDLETLAGVLLSSMLFSLLAVVMVGRSASLTSVLARVPVVALPLLAPVLVHGSGLLPTPWWQLSPAVGAFDLLAGDGTWSAASWVALWVVGLALAAERIGFDVRPAPPPRPRRPRAGARPSRRNGPVRSFLQVDARLMRTDRILLLVLAGMPLIALALRWFTADGVAWLAEQRGIDLSSQVPLLRTFVVVVHIPAMVGMVTGLLATEDRDAHLLPAVHLTRASLPTLLGYRLGATALLGCAAVGAVAAIAGGGLHPDGAAASVVVVVAAGTSATVPAALLAVVARDRVHGMALAKLLGIPLYVPLAWWFVGAPWGWAFAVSPTWWAARASWAQDTAAAVGFGVGGLVLIGALLAILLARMRPL